MRPHTEGLRRFHYVAILLVTSVGVFTFLLSADTERLFAWLVGVQSVIALVVGVLWAYLLFLAGVLALGLYGPRRSWMRAGLAPGAVARPAGP